MGRQQQQQANDAAKMEEIKAEQEKMLLKLMSDVNDLIRSEKDEKPKWRKFYRNEDPRAIFYHRMLKRLGLPEKHARFAPWFYKSQRQKLDRFSIKLFEGLERDYIIAQQGMTEGERALASYQAFIQQIKGHKDIEPRQINQMMLRRAFRDCSFVAPETDLERQQRVRDTHPAFRQHDPENHIPLVEYKNPAPGLAPPVQGQVESFGKHVYFNYQGRWKDGHMSTGNFGQSVGTYTFTDGGKYSGEWKDSVQSGAGVAEYPNGVNYTGEWLNGRYHGSGTLEYRNKTKYEGTWKNGSRHGKGKITYPSGATYEGDFFMGYKEGNGVATSAAGHRYSGEWKRNRILGYGSVVLANGKKILKEKWGPCVLGEAIAEAKRIFNKEKEIEVVEMRRLQRVRDDLRALDLQLAYRERKRIEDEKKEQLRKEKLKQVRKEKKEAQEAAKDAFLKEMLVGGEEDDDESDDDESESDETDESSSDDDSSEDDD